MQLVAGSLQMCEALIRTTARQRKPLLRSVRLQALSRPNLAWLNLSGLDRHEFNWLTQQ